MASRPPSCFVSRRPAALLLIASLFTGSGACAQDDVPPQSEVQPKDCDLGSLTQGSVVHASFHVRWSADADGDATLELPASVTLLKTVAPRAGRTTFFVAIVTGRLGGLDETIIARRGPATARMPLKGVVLPAVPGASRVLVADAPWEADSTDDSSTFATWRRVVRQGKLEVDYVLGRAVDGPVFTAERLRRVDVVLLGEYSLTSLRAEDAACLTGYVCGGGRLVVAANAFFGNSVERANVVLRPFGIQMLDTEPAAGRGPIDMTGAALAADVLMADVETVKVHRPSPLVLDDEGAVSLAAVDDGEHPVIAVTRTRSGGEIVALSQSLWWLWASRHPGNEQLLRNLLRR